jgi:hypothetical protein
MHVRPRPQRVRREAGQCQILAKVAGLDRPAFRPQVGQDLRAEQENRLVGITVRCLRPPTVEITLYALERNGEMADCSLREPASPALPGLEAYLDYAAVHLLGSKVG